jgi:hypothetical protein
LQGIPPPRYYGAPLDDLQRYAIHQEQQLMNDEHQQTMRVYDMQHWDRLTQYERNDEDLIQQEQLAQWEQWEDVAFRLQQLK